MGGWCPPCASLGIEHVAVDLSAVDLRVVPHHTIRGLNAAVIIECFQQFFIAANVILLNEVVDALIILNPEHNVPGFVVSPTVVGAVGEVGLVGCGCHWWFGCELRSV